MHTKSWGSTLLCLIITLTLFSNVMAFSIPDSQITEEKLEASPVVTAFYNAHLGKTAYYPSLSEEDLVVLGSAYLAPLFVIESGRPELYLNAIVALREVHFGFSRIEFDIAEDELSWEVEAHDASGNGFIADEIYLKVDERLMKVLAFIAAHPEDAYHVSFWGHSDQPLHFALTRNQIQTIRDFLNLYFGIETMESVSV